MAAAVRPVRSKSFIPAIEKGDSKAIGQLMTPEAAQMMIMMGEKAKGMVVASGGISKTEETINRHFSIIRVFSIVNAWMAVLSSTSQLLSTELQKNNGKDD
jgi:hypothetical protein